MLVRERERRRNRGRPHQVKFPVGTYRVSYKYKVNTTFKKIIIQNLSDCVCVCVCMYVLLTPPKPLVGSSQNF